MDFIAKTLYGLEPLAEEEIKLLGGRSIEQMNRAVAFKGDKALLYKINLTARSILRILVPIASFTAHNDRHLYQLAKKIKWDDYLGVDRTFAIDSTAYGKRFTHSQYAALKVKDAIVDQFKESHGQRPSVDTNNPDVRINLHISETSVSISLDGSGESLEKRGYRTEHNEAPISECLAAAMVMLSGWDKKTMLIDAMTGSGTIAIEAALLATHTPPGLHRKFGFQSWVDYDPALFEQITNELRSNIKQPEGEIHGWDIDIRSIALAKRNATRAGVLEYIQFKSQDFMHAEPIASKAYLLMNPPYGERLEEDEDMPDLYHNIGFRLKHHFAGHEAWVISGNLRAMKMLGLKPSQKLKLYNGPIECRLSGFSLFEGKAKK